MWLQEVTGGNKGLKRLQGVTRSYSGFQGVTGGYKGLQRVTRSYRGLQGVTGSYKRSPMVTRGYGGLQRIKRVLKALRLGLGLQGVTRR